MESRKNNTPPDNSFQDGDPRLIEIDVAAERAYWCKSLDVTEEQLTALVQAVGPSAQRVKEHLSMLRAGEP